MNITRPVQPSSVSPSQTTSSHPSAESAHGTGRVDSFVSNASSSSTASKIVDGSCIPDRSRTLGRPTLLKDDAVHAQFEAAGTHLSNLWDRVLDTVDSNRLDAAILDIADQNAEQNFSAKLPQSVLDSLDATLREIHRTISDTPGIEPALKSAVARYFTLASYQARLDRGDQYMLSAPATPVKVVSQSDGSKDYLTYDTIAQSSEAFALINPESDVFVEPVVEDPYLGVKKFFLYSLMLSGNAMSFYNGIAQGRAQLRGQPEKLEGGWFGGAKEPRDSRVHGKETLREVDNRGLMRPELDNQGQHGYCWTFAASRLAEEQICKSTPDSSDCKSRVSPLDISYDNWRFASPSEGGFIGDGLQNTIDHGVCSNEKAFYPSAAQEREIVNHINGYFKAVLQEPGNVNHTAWKTLTLENGNQTVTLNNQMMDAVQTVELQSQSWFRFWQWPLRMGIWQNPLGSNLRTTVSTLSSGDAKISQTLRDTLINEGCTDHRITGAFDNLNHSTKFWSPYNTERTDKLESMKEALQHGNSLGVGMCVSRHMGRGGCGGHAIVMDGVRYDDQADKWEAHFINSWGEDSEVMNGWKDLGDIIDDIIGITYYHPQSTPALRA